MGIKAWATAARAGHSRLATRVKQYPGLLVVLFPAYAIVSFVLVVAAILIAVGCINLFGPGSEGLVLALATLLLVVPTLGVLWTHYMALSVMVAAAVVRIEGDTRRVLQVVQLLVTTVLLFGAIHYYVLVFSDGAAYEGIRLKGTIDPDHPPYGVLGALLTVPSAETVVDCLYFSTVTLATVGYGDVHPVSSLAKLICMAEMGTGFVLVVVCLGWAISNVKAAAVTPPAAAPLTEPGSTPAAVVPGPPKE